MAASTFGNRLFRGGLVGGQRVMPKSEEAPAVCFGKPLTVFDGQVDTVVLAIEIPPSGWFGARAVWKGRIKNSSQFFYNDCSFGKGACPQKRIDIFLFDVYMMIFGEARLSVVQAVGGQGSPNENPPTKDGWV